MPGYDPFAAGKPSANDPFAAGKPSANDPFAAGKPSANDPYAAGKSSNNNDPFAESDYKKKYDFSFMEEPKQLTRGQIVKMKMKENPFVPLFLGITIGAFFRGLYFWNKKDSVRQQHMMRLRVGAQGCALFALVGGYWYQEYKLRNKKPIEETEGRRKEQNL